jgi:hypothetical protein
MGKKSDARFNDVSMFSLGNAILLRGMGTRNTMKNSRGAEKLVKAMILPSPIGLNNQDFGIE